MKEIGSEFWTTEPNAGQELFFVSGRTALDYIIRDILVQRTVKQVFMPSYCCHSMIEPFLRNKVSVKFYHVYPENGTLKADIPKLTSDDIFFSMKYFGYKNQDMEQTADIKDSGCTVICDRTHSWLTDSDNFAHYSFTSYRKWTGLTGIASARKLSGQFFQAPKEKTFEKYEQLRLEAQQKKEAYIQSGLGEKDEFLSLFSHAEELLDLDYTDYTPTLKSLSSLFTLDKRQISSARQENAQTLYKMLPHIPGVTPIFSETTQDDVPLCVPILVGSGLRDELRRYLISENIYCPVHWPISHIHGGISPQTRELYDTELSLICDQRYTPTHMEQIAETIEKFFEQKELHYV